MLERIDIGKGRFALVREECTAKEQRMIVKIQAAFEGRGDEAGFLQGCAAPAACVREWEGVPALAEGWGACKTFDEYLARVDLLEDHLSGRELMILNRGIKPRLFLGETEEGNSVASSESGAEPGTTPQD